jgi:serine/threonine protein phosphatase PrpC
MTAQVITVVGVFWLSLVVTLLLVTTIRARLLGRRDTLTRDGDDGGARRFGGWSRGPRIPWRLWHWRSVYCSGQRVPVVAPDGGKVHVPEIAGMSARGSSNRGQLHDTSVLLRVGPSTAGMGRQPYALLVIAVGLARSSPRADTSAWVAHIIGDHAARGMEGDQPASPTGLLTQTLASIHSDLRERNVRLHTDHGVTVTVALLVGGVAHIASIGDSRAYIYNPIVGLRQITTDHSIVAALVANRLLSPDALYTHPRRGYIYRCLGLNAQSQVDAFQVALQSDDRLVLCSDKFWQALRHTSTEAILRTSQDPQQAAERLLSTALQTADGSQLCVVVARPLGTTTTSDIRPSTLKPASHEETLNQRGIASLGQ